MIHEETKYKVTIEISDAELVSGNFSDILCWWHGFQTGLQIIGESQYNLSPALNGIESIRKLNIELKDAILKAKRGSK